jgi:hypothetical protein
MKIKSIVETTTSGSIATVATNITPGKPIKRQSSTKVKTEKKLYANSLHEGDDSREKQDDNDLKNTVYNPFDRNREQPQKPDPRSEKYRKMVASKAASRKAVKEEGYQDTIQSRYDAQMKKYDATPIGPLDEAEIRENDVVVSPDKGSRTKTGLLSKDKNGILAKFVPPFKATGCWVSDKRGNRMSECETAEIASEVARVLNSEIKNPTTIKETEEVYEEDDNAVGTGWSNAKALLQAYERKASAEIQLGDDVVMLEYPEVRFVLGIYKQAVKDGRHEEILRLLADPYKFHKMMKKMGNMLYRDRSSQNAEAAGKRLAGGLGEARRKNTVTYNYKLPDKKVGKAEVPIPDADDDDDSWNSDTSSGYDRDELRRQAIMRSIKEGAKVDRMVKHIAKSEKDLGKSKKDAESIAWATVNKRGMLDNKNKKSKE